MRSFVCFFCKQKTAYEMRISDWSSDVCSSDLLATRVVSLCSQPACSRGDRSRRAVAACARLSQRQGVASWAAGPRDRAATARPAPTTRHRPDRKSVEEGKRVSVRVDLAGRRIIKQKKHKDSYIEYTQEV